MNLISKIDFLRKKQKVVLVIGEGRKSVIKVIADVLKRHFNLEKDILIFESKYEDLKKFEFLLRKSQKPVLVITGIKNLPEEKINSALEFIKTLPDNLNLILNFDEETIRKKHTFSNSETFTFGFQEGADFRVSDVKSNGGTNFKINYQGKVIPVWLEKISDKEKIYAAISAVVVGTVFSLNLVEISQALK